MYSDEMQNEIAAVNKEENRTMLEELVNTVYDRIEDVDAIETTLAAARLSWFMIVMEELNNEQLGALIREYVGEAAHNNFDGTPAMEQIAIGRFLQDVARYHRATFF